MSNLTLENVAAVIALLLTIPGLAALIFLGFKGAFNKARIEALREDNTDLRARVEDHESKILALEQKEVALEGENALLRDMVMQRANVDGLGELLKEHHRQAMEHWEQLTNALINKDTK